jgi:Xaa-Pro aminopeptidase
MTRTWCLGTPTERLRVVFQDVLDCYRAVTAALRPGMPCAELQQIACRFFGQRGHPTSCSDPTTQVGYVHSLGHGLGLDVHEEPRLSDLPGNDSVLRPGCVVTIEPGLYYPEEGIGVRIEDVWYLDERENFVNLTDYPTELEICGIQRYAIIANISSLSMRVLAGRRSECDPSDSRVRRTQGPR